MRVTIILLILVAIDATLIGSIAGDYVNGAVKLNERTLRYARVTAYVDEMISCSGVIGKIALTRTSTDSSGKVTYHEISFSFQNHRAAVCCRVQEFEVGFANRNVWFESCVDPPGDPSSIRTALTIAWTSANTIWQVGGRTIATFSNPPQSPVRAYQNDHELYFGIHRGPLPAEDGIPSTTCPDTARRFRIQSLEITPLVNDIFDAANLITYSLQTSALSWNAWTDSSRWDRLNSFYISTADEIKLQSQVSINADGLLIQHALVDAFQGIPGRALLLNSYFQDITVIGTQEDPDALSPQPWAAAAEFHPLVRIRADPFDDVAMGALNFQIHSTGTTPGAIRLSQIITSFPSELPEMCLWMRIRTDWARAIQVYMHPGSDSTLAGRNLYFGEYRLALTAGTTFQAYSICFAPPSSATTNPPVLVINLGAVDQVAMKEHVLSFASIELYQVGQKAPDGFQWTGTTASEILRNNQFDLGTSFWNYLSGAAAQPTAVGNVYQFNIRSNTQSPPNIRLRQQLVRVRNNHSYRIGLTARSRSAAATAAGFRFVLVTLRTEQGASLLGGTMVARITTTSSTHFIYFKSQFEVKAPAPSEDGAGILTIDVGGATEGFGTLNDDVVLESVSLLEWKTDTPLPAITTIPNQPSELDRPPIYFTPQPDPPQPTKTPAPTPEPVAVTAEPFVIPDRFTNQTTLKGVYGVIYQSPLYILQFKGITIEEVAINIFAANMSTIMIDLCKEKLGNNSKECILTPANVVIVEVCYSNLVTPNNHTGMGADPRACLGQGAPIRTSVEVNSTDLDTYMIYTYAGLPPALLESTWLDRLLNTLNNRIETGAIGVRPSGAAALLVDPRPPRATPVPGDGDYGLENWEWILVTCASSLCAGSIGFYIWYHHRLRKMRKAAGTKALFRGDYITTDVIHTRFHQEGVLQLDKLGMLKKQFDVIDTDRGGTLSRSEVWDVLYRIPSLRVPMSLPGRFNAFFRKIDLDGNEEIEFSEFAVGFMPFLIHCARSTETDEDDIGVEEMFRKWCQLGGSSVFEDKPVDPHHAEELESDQLYLIKLAIDVVRKLSVTKAAEEAASVGSIREIENPSPSGGTPRSSSPSLMYTQKPYQIREDVLVTIDSRRYARAEAIIAEDERFDPEDRPDFEDFFGNRGVVNLVDVDSDYPYSAIRVDFPDKGVEFLFHPLALDRPPKSSLVRWTQKADRKEARSYETYCIIRACIAGLVSGLLCATAEYFAEDEFSSDDPTKGNFNFTTNKETPYWVIVVCTAIVLTTLEVLFLYYDALRTSMKISEKYGMVLHPVDDERIFHVAAICRCCLELSHTDEERWGINPQKNKSAFAKRISTFMTKLGHPSSFGVFMFRVAIKRLLTRAVAKSLLVWIATPLTMIANGLVARLVLNNARIAAIGPRLITKMLENITGNQEPPRWHIGSTYVNVEHFEKLSVQILRAVGSVVVARGHWHPNLEILYKFCRKKLGTTRATQRRTLHDIDNEDEHFEFNAHDMGELRIQQAIKLDCMVMYDIDCIDKLVAALRLDSDADKLRNEAMIDSDSDDEEVLDLCYSDDSSEYGESVHIALNETEKVLVLKVMVLAVLVSGGPSRECHNILRRAFSSAGGDVTTNPQKTIDALYRFFQRGALHDVVENFDLVFRPHRTLQGDRQSTFQRALNLGLEAVDW